MAAHLVISRVLDSACHDYKSPSLIAAFDRYATVPEGELFDVVKQFWGTDVSRRSYYQLAVGVDGLKKIEHEKFGQSEPEKYKIVTARLRGRWSFKLYYSAVWPLRG